MYKPALDTQQAFDCRATAAWLHALAPVVWASQVCALAAFYGGAWIALPCWVAVLYLAVRAHLDAALLDLLAQDPEQAPGRLDDWLARAGWRSPAVAARSMAGRCRGARRLGVYLVSAFAMQVLLLVFAGWHSRT